jgi:Uncharacterised protein family (UPF0259)
VSEPARGEAHLSIRRTLAEAAALYLRHWKILGPLAMVVLLPQAVIGTFIGEIEVDRVESVGDVLKVVAIPGTLLVSLAGEALLAGVITALVLEWRAGHARPEPRAFMRRLPWMTLIVMDLLLAVGAAVGLLLLVVPGFVFLTYFAIGPAVIEIERRGVRDALRRSATLVHGRFRQVFPLIIGAILVTEGVGEVLVLILHGFAPELVSAVAADALIESVQGLIVALVAISLIQLHGDRIPERSRTVEPADSDS